MSSDQKNQDALIQRASLYVVRLYSGELTAKEEQEIIAWCDESDAHQYAFDEALIVWESSRHIVRSAGWRDKLERRFYHMRYIAASILLFVVSVSIFLPFSSEEVSELVPSKQHFATAVGEVSNVGLSDGSQITLNTASKIRVAFSVSERELWLEKGEAFFDIAKDQSRPFLIHMHEKTVRVVGTKFNIRLSKSGFDIAVEEGVVAVEDNQASGTQNSMDSAPLLLEAGAIASFNKTSSLIAKENAETVVKAHSWRTGYLRFDDERLDNVIENFNRYRNKKIVIDKESAQLRISGVFKLSDGDAILTALEATLPIAVQRQENNIKIVKK